MNGLHQDQIGQRNTMENKSVEGWLLEGVEELELQELEREIGSERQLKRLIYRREEMD